MKYNKRTILAKIETVYGTDIVPTAPLNAILVRNISFTPLKVNADERNLVRSYFGNFEQIVGAAYGMCEIEVELAGAGALGVAPKWSPLLLACAHSETIVATISVTYKPITDNEQSATIYYFQDQNLYKLVGCKGSVSFDFNEQKIPIMKFKMTGLRTAVAALAATGAVYTGFQKPLAVNKANTTLSIQGFSLPTSKFMMDQNATMNYINRINREAVDYTDRKTQGDLEIEEPIVSVVDWYQRTLDTTTGALALVHGTVPGQRIKINAPTVQVTEPTQGEIQNTTTLKMGLRFNPGAVGDDEYALLLD